MAMRKIDNHLRGWYRSKCQEFHKRGLHLQLTVFVSQESSPPHILFPHERRLNHDQDRHQY